MGAAGLALAVALLGAACSEKATPIGAGSTGADGTGAETTQQVTPHLLAPTEQMKQLARQQCLDHPDKVQGVVNAIDPGRPGQVLATVTLDCASVRAGGSGEIDSTTTTSPAATSTTP